MRAWLPREIGGVLWFGNDDANMVAYTPVYCGMTRRPECYNTPGADDLTFSDKNAFWVCNWVSNMVYPRYNQLFPSLRVVRDSLERGYFTRQAEVEKEAMRLYGQDPELAAKYLNDYSVEQSSATPRDWERLLSVLVTRRSSPAKSFARREISMLTPPSKRQTRIYIKGKSLSRGFPFVLRGCAGRLPMTAGVSSQDGNIMRFWLWRLGVPRLPEQDCRIKIAACEGLVAC